MPQFVLGILKLMGGCVLRISLSSLLSEIQGTSYSIAQECFEKMIFLFKIFIIIIISIALCAITEQ